MNPINPQGFDWSLIRSFLAALDAGSLMGAARALHTSQPTLGRHVAELESQLGLTLFERTGRGLVATASALQLEASARAMEAGALQLSRGVSGAQVRASGTVRITASQPVACYLMPQILADMRRTLPDSCSAPASMARAEASSCSALAVATRPRPVRSNRVNPSCDSSSAMCRPSVGWLVCSARAPPIRLPASSAARKLRTRLQSNSRFIFVIHE